MYNIIVFFSLFSFYCFSADVEKSFHRINSSSGTFEVLFKDYSRDAVSIKLIPMAHFAEESFYSKVNKEITGKTVIYELAGGDYKSQKIAIDQKERMKNLATQLGPSFALVFDYTHKIVDKFYAFAHKYKAVTQIDSVDYDLAHVLSHADIISPEIDSNFRETEKMLANPEEFKNLQFIEPAKTLVTRRAIQPSNNEDELIKGMSHYLKTRLDIKIANLPPIDIFIKQLLEQDKVMLASKESFYQEFVAKRNQLVFDRTNEVLSQSNVPTEIVISYGAGHMPMIEEFLLSIGFSPKKDGEEWVKVISLN